MAGSIRLRFDIVTAIALVAIAIGLEGAMAQQSTTPPAEMLGVEWSLVSLQDASGATQDMTGAGMTIRFEQDGMAFGSGGCNTFRGGYTVADGQQLTFSALAATLMACEQALMDRETVYLQALDDVSAYRLDGSSGLQLIFGNGQGVLRFTAGQPTTLPATAEAGVDTGLLVALGVLVCAAGLLIRRWRLASPRS
ncbi:MAG: META domain-containing protein [Chloroflexota bacterium]